MNKLKASDLWKLEEYSERRPAFRTQVIAHKKLRKVHIGPHLTLLFEDRITIQYQVQEMLRIERIFERAGIEEELEAYNPLIPDGENWKATCLIEFEDPAERAIALTRLRGVEAEIFVQIGDLPKVVPFSDEDLERENETKTSAVHFLRFELTEAQITALKQGAALRFGVDHPQYRHATTVDDAVRNALIADLA
ncbi:MAG: DUF3501 family protein [Nevskia sp.]|jgi:hypothetical protein|nr:DUF3501 family protein [Nevskia sp.]MCK9386234.1 DUF3501 family protein [Nevskia sp.]